MYKIISSLNFNTVINGSKVAKQIAALLNQNNELFTVHSIDTVSRNSCLYLVYIYQGDVIGCTGLRVEHPTLTRNLHTSVAPFFRKKGVGKYLIWQAIENCTTQNMFVTIRPKNKGSLNLYKSLGFTFVEERFNRNHKLFVLGRRIK